MNALEIAQEVANRMGLSKPSSLVGSRNAQDRQLYGLLNGLCDDLRIRKVYSVNILECTFQSVNAEDQGALSDLAPYGFRGIIQDTFFDRTRRLRVPGGLTPSEYQAGKATRFAGPFTTFRIVRGHLLLYPAPPAGHDMIFEYCSGYFVRDTSGQPKQYITDDSDTFIVDDSITIAWLKQAFKREKGLEYAEDFTDYQLQVSDLMAKDGAARPIDMSYRPDVRPGIMVPEGNWMQT